MYRITFCLSPGFLKPNNFQQFTTGNLLGVWLHAFQWWQLLLVRCFSSVCLCNPPCSSSSWPLSSSDWCLKDHFLEDSVWRVLDNHVPHPDIISGLTGAECVVSGCQTWVGTDCCPSSIICASFLHALDGFKISDVSLTAAKKVFVAVKMFFTEIEKSEAFLLKIATHTHTHFPHEILRRDSKGSIWNKIKLINVKKIGCDIRLEWIGLVEIYMNDVFLLVICKLVNW